MRRALIELLHRAPLIAGAASSLLSPELARAEVPSRGDDAADELAPPSATSTPPAPVPSRGAPVAGVGSSVRDRLEEHGYSPYERDAIQSALDRLHAILELAPEGKLVEAIDIIPLDVIEERDPAPAFLNWFHVTSWPYVIRREVLLTIGSRYAQVLADETARNLRAIDQLSLVLVFAARGSRPDRVRVVVVTKDVWSLRLNSNYRIAGGQLEYLFLQPSEQNLVGIHHAVAAQISLDPGSLSLGVGYSMPRIGGSHVLLRTQINAIFARETGDLEGSFGSFVYGQPLYSTAAAWAWGATIGWRNEVTRRFVGGKLATFPAKAIPEEDRLDYVYRSDLQNGSFVVTRSFGGALSSVKHDVSIGASADRKVFRAGDLSGVSPVTARAFERELPVSDTQIGPTFEYHTYATRFSRVLDVDTLALQEDYRVGHDLAIKLYPAFKALNSSRNVVGVAVAAAYTVPLGDGLVRAVVKSTTEIERTRLPDASLDLRARIHTPSFGIGRFVFDVRLIERYRNYLNRRTQLGGEGRLRGYPSGAFIGEDAFAANLELRSRPVEILSCQLAGAAFFDAGDTFDSFDEIRVKQSAGFGLRLLFPQLNRVVMRADWGFPLTRGYDPDSFPGDVVITFYQAFSMPSPSTEP